MSSFKINAKCKETGSIFEVWCMDDYFGRHIYGYCVHRDGCVDAMREDDFYNEYEAVEND